MSAGFITFMVAVLAGVILYSGLQSRREVADEPRTAGALMAKLAAEAVEAAKEGYGMTLDYTPDSIERVEGILSQLHEEHRQCPFTRERLVAAANRWGSYVGETARRAKGGDWQRYSLHVRGKAYPLVLGEHEIYPCGWCGKRIANGPEDNVWVKYQLTLLREELATDTISVDG